MALARKHPSTLRRWAAGAFTAWLFGISATASHGQADLVVTSFNFTDSVGPAVAWNVTIKNQGNTKAQGNVLVRLYIVLQTFQQDFLTVGELNGLDPGRSRTFNGSSDFSNIPNVGRDNPYSTRAVVDPNNTVAESDEDNNRFNGGMVTLGTPVEPDRPTVLSISPTNGKAGDTVTLTGRLFGSGGSGTAVGMGNLGVEMVIASWSDSLVRFMVHSSVVAGRSYTVTVYTDGKSAPAPFEFQVDAPTSMRPAERTWTALRLNAIRSTPIERVARIVYQVPATGRVSLRIFDDAGRAVVTLVDRTLTPGTYSVAFDASSNSGRRYFARLQSGRTAATKLFQLP